MGEIARTLTESGWDWKGLPVLLVDKLTAEPPLESRQRPAYKFRSMKEGNKNGKSRLSS